MYSMGYWVIMCVFNGLLGHYVYIYNEFNGLLGYYVYI